MIFPIESVREHHLGLHSFRSMRRIEASLRKASALRLRHSQSLASLRHRPSQAKVRSTSQRFGSTDEALGLIGALDDLDVHALENSPQCILEACALISTIGVEFQEKRIFRRKG